MNIIFIAKVRPIKTEGIYKKIVSQCKSLSNRHNNCRLLIPQNSKLTLAIEFYDGKIIFRKSFDYSYFFVAKMFCNQTDIYYIRRMVMNFNLALLFIFLKKKRKEIFFEIPTYPYFMEQIRTNRNKIKGVLKVLLDCFFYPVMYYCVTKIIVVKSRNNIHLFNKMLEITNGIDVDVINSKIKNNTGGRIDFVGIGTIYPYHGYDRFLKSLQAFDEKIDGIDLFTHIIGESQTIEELKILANNLNLHNVSFDGKKGSDDLNNMFEKYDIGLGCMALYKRNADIDTTLKAIEYSCRGIPFITSGLFYFEKEDSSKCIYKVDNNSDLIDLKSIVRKYCSTSIDEKKVFRKKSLNRFSWSNIMKKILEK